MEKNKVSVCIVVLNSLPYLKQCLDALKKATDFSYEVLVLDLGKDGTEKWVKNKKITYFKKKLPFYFAQANNFLASKATGNVLLFLNPDTIPKQEFLEKMLMEFNNPLCAVVGCKLVYPPLSSQKGTIQHAGVEWKGEYPTADSLPQHIGLYETSASYTGRYKAQAITGACLLIRKEMFQKLGGFDEKFKNGYEDVDLCIRAKQAGYECWYVGEAEVIHYVSGAMGTDGKHRTSGEFQDYNTRILLQKYTPKRTKKVKPVRPYRIIKKNKQGGYINRLIIGTPTTGEVRMEWVMARYGQVIPMNWSMVQMVQFMNPYAPIGYTTADAQNLIVKAAIDQEFEWLLLVEHDNILPEDALVRFNRYIREESVPVVSGLYYTKARPSEPLVFRGRGTSVYTNFSIGDKVWADGVPTGCLLIHMGILREMWKESPEYMAGDTKTRRVFNTPRKVWFDPQSAQYNALTGTSDLDWCTRVMEGQYFAKAGWDELQKKKYPFLVDTNIFCKHIDSRGVQYP